jgi:hypothetical protein
MDYPNESDHLRNPADSRSHGCAIGRRVSTNGYGYPLVALLPLWRPLPTDVEEQGRKVRTTSVKRLLAVALIAATIVAWVGTSNAAQAAPKKKHSTHKVTKHKKQTKKRASVDSSQPSRAQIDSAINAVYYNLDQAFQNSTADGFQAWYQDDYPGSVNKSTFFACASKSENQQYSEDEVLNRTGNFGGSNPRREDRADAYQQAVPT